MNTKVEVRDEFLEKILEAKKLREAGNKAKQYIVSGVLLFILSTMSFIGGLVAFVNLFI
jgi:hypothetical protein